LSSLDHYNVIRAIDGASRKELTAIARVEDAVKNGSNSVASTLQADVAIKNRRREQAKSDFSPVADPARSTSDAETGISFAPKVTPSFSFDGSPVADENPLQQEQVDLSRQTNKLLEGLWQDSQGLWRQQSGAFATRQQKEAAETKSADRSDTDDRLSSKVLSWIGDKLNSTEKGNEAVDAAGVATAGSEWMAGKELYNLTKEAKQLISDKGLDSKEGIKSAVKSIYTKAVSPSQWFSKSDDKPAPVISETPKEKPAEKKEQDRPTGTVGKAQRKAISLLSKVFRPAQWFSKPASSGESLPGDLSKPNAQSKGSSSGSQRQQQSGSVSSAVQARKNDGLTDLISESLTEQTETLSSHLKKIEDAVKEIKPGAGAGGSLLDSALDLFGDRKGRKSKRGSSRYGRGAARTGSKTGSLIGMGAGSAASAGAKSGIGAAAKAGGAVLSKLALPLTAALAIYDGFSGYNDKDKQKETFKLKEGQDATTGQKSAMAAGSILSLGGLTELIGISDQDIAKSLYNIFGGDPDKESGTSVAPEQKATESPTAGAAPAKQKAATPSAPPAMPATALASSSAANRSAPALAVTATLAPPVQSGLMIGNGANAARGYSAGAANLPQMSELAPTNETPPMPSKEPLSQESNRQGGQPSINVIAHTDPKLTRAIEAMAKGQQQQQLPVVSKSKETINSQTHQVSSQIPNTLSSETMRMIAMDLM
jgi:hypothetical protein